MPGSPPTTPRLGIPRIGLTDLADVPHDLNAAVDAVDAQAIVKYIGGYSSIAATTGMHTGDLYQTTDTHEYYIYTGTAWQLITPGITYSVSTGAHTLSAAGDIPGTDLAVPVPANRNFKVVVAVTGMSTAGSGLSTVIFLYNDQTTDSTPVLRFANGVSDVRVSVPGLPDGANAFSSMGSLGGTIPLVYSATNNLKLKTSAGINLTSAVINVQML